MSITVNNNSEKFSQMSKRMRKVGKTFFIYAGSNISGLKITTLNIYNRNCFIMVYTKLESVSPNE